MAEVKVAEALTLKDSEKRVVTVRNKKVLFIRHEGEQNAACAIDAFTDGPGDFVIGPEADTGFLVGRDIRGDDIAQLRVFCQLHARSFAFRLWRGARQIHIALGMAEKAAGDTVHEVVATFESG